MPDDADVIIVGAGLAGLVAAAELTAAGKKAIIVEQGAGAVAWRPGIGGLFLGGMKQAPPAAVATRWRSHRMANFPWSILQPNGIIRRPHKCGKTAS
ncbi:FAD-dependent oxidoreductase [Mesorhizobium sp. M0195]|uniref:FAD-dependent oxidoreductase n=1 Tax=unclassified Mesorhizobium TaxID=325217 RepID=UPI00333BB402